MIISIKTDLRPEDCGCEAGLVVPLAAAAAGCALPHRTSSLLLPSTSFLPFPLLIECSECLEKNSESGLRIRLCFMLILIPTISKNLDVDPKNII